jgi:putative addiction module CopG family antidote
MFSFYWRVDSTCDNALWRRIAESAIEHLNCVRYSIVTEIYLKPELEELIRQDVQRGCYRTVDESVERAVSMLHEQEAWLAQNRVVIAAKIDEGYAAAQRGELVEADTVRSKLAELKSTHSANPRQE